MSEQKQFDYSAPKQMSVPMYKYRSIAQDSAVALSLTQTCTSEFQIPNLVMNLSMSYLEFTIKLADLNTKYNSFHYGLLPFDGIRLVTSRGTVLINRDNCRVQSRVLLPLTTARNDWSEKGVSPSVQATANHADLIRGNGFVKSNALESANGSLQIAHGGARTAAVDKAYYYPTAFASGAVGNGGAGQGHLFVKFRVYLKDVVHSFLANGLDIYPAEKMTLSVVWAMGSHYGLTADDANLGTPVALATSPEFTSAPVLYVAVQSNPSIAQQVMEKCLSGHREVYQDTVEFKTSTPNTETSYSKTFSLRAQHGVQLLRAYHALVINDDAKTLECNNNNLGSSKWSEVRTYTQSVADTDYKLSPETSWSMNQMVYSDNLICTSKLAEHFSCHVQDFSGVGGSALAHNKIDSGISLNKQGQDSVDLQLELTKVGFSGSQYTWCVVNRAVQFGAQGIQLVA